VVLSRYGGGMFGYLLDLARDGEPSAWAEGSIAGRSAEVRVAGVGDRELVVRLAGEALVLSRG
jgi:hypothetical protein